MYTVESLGLEHETPILGIFGTETFTNIAKGELKSDRRACLRKIIGIFKGVRPRLVYIIPKGRTCLYATHLLKVLNIPFCLVIPCQGYFDNLKLSYTRKFEEAVRSAQSIIMLNDEEINLKNFNDIEDDAEEFILQRAELILSIYGKNPSERYKKLNDRLNDMEADVIFLNYSL
mgnify:CR=1 FL=1|jgi:hypothetical protein|tara:strand:+ start:54 stop:575 length:522 start_codon:yes stop_codon:yes gene_type:complete